MDGVLADFDKRASAILGMDSYKFEFQHGTQEFWSRLNEDPDLFASFEPLPDAMELWAAVEDRDPAILTALPKTNGERVSRQKREWVARHFGPHVEVITCRSHDKPDYAGIGDVLVDDRATYRGAWEANGGKFVHHQSAASSIIQLKSLGII